MKHREAIVAETAFCAYCPTLCLHACPVATAEATDAVSPWGKMSLARWLATGRARMDADAASVLSACTSCGSCADACDHHVFVAGVLRKAREACVEAGASPFGPEVFEPIVEDDDQAILPPGVSGVRLYEAGYTDRFLQVARAAARRWSRRPEVVFASAEDAACVRQIWPEHDIELGRPVVLASERPGARPFESVAGRVAYFEACHVARGGADADMVRVNAQQLVDGDLIELRWTGPKATCCGAGGVWSARDPEAARRAARRILDNAAMLGADTLVVGCASCAAHLADAAADRAEDARIAVQAIGTDG